ncbi:MAG: undecaprenyl-diphosphatase [Solirubrobacterales bacterium]|jgi:undecaprenyl-diphosphatase|nr:undecaprenyl-diphosphatase [Solirubrobacterales bacterium]
MDFTLYHGLNSLAVKSDRIEDVLQFIALYGQYFFVALLAGLFLARGKWASRNARHGVIAAGLSAALALGIAQVLASLWERPRPYVTHPGDAHLFIAPSPDTSFPSDHATAAFAIATAIWLRSRRAGEIAFVMAGLLAVSRVAVGTHYPSDVLAGAVVGVAAALFFWIPAIREPLHRLADWLGSVYEGLVAAVLARVRSV